LKALNYFFNSEKMDVFKHSVVHSLTLLGCVHVSEPNESDKKWSLYCDSTFKSQTYKGEYLAKGCPRYSGVEYTVNGVTYEGQILAIVFFYATDAHDNVSLHLKFVVARFKDSEEDARNKALGFNVRCYDKDERLKEVQIDVIDATQIQRPIFYVPALDFGLSITDVSVNNRGRLQSRTQRNSFFYVLSEGTVTCAEELMYNHYLERNVGKFCNTSVPQYLNPCLNFKPYMTVSEMNDLKEMLFIGVEAECRNDFEFDYDEIDDYMEYNSD